MSRSPNRLSSILLMLLLAFSPLRSVVAMAGADFHNDVEKGLSGMVHDLTGGMSMDDHQGMNTDCRHCDGQSGCNGHDCSHSHCASCVPGLLCFIQQTVTIAGSDSYSVLEPVFSSRFTSHPFRPPKA